MPPDLTSRTDALDHIADARETLLCRGQCADQAIKEFTSESGALQALAAATGAAAFRQRDPLACGILALQHFHGPNPSCAMAFLDVLERFLASEPRRHGYRSSGQATLHGIFLLAKRKSPGRPKPKPSEPAIKAINTYLRPDSVADEPAAAAIVSLLSTIDPSDELAAKAQNLLCQVMPEFILKQDLWRMALGVFGASPFLPQSDVRRALQLLRTACEHDILDTVELASCSLLAAHFARHIQPEEATAIARIATVKLSALILQGRSNLARRRDVAGPPTVSAFRRPLARTALGLAALHQVGAVDLHQLSEFDSGLGLEET